MHTAPCHAFLTEETREKPCGAGGTQFMFLISTILLRIQCYPHVTPMYILNKKKGPLLTGGLSFISVWCRY